MKKLAIIIGLFVLAPQTFAAKVFTSTRSASINAIYENSAMNVKQLDTLVQNAKGQALIQCLDATNNDYSKCKLLFAKIVKVNGVDGARSYEIQIKITAQASYQAIP